MATGFDPHSSDTVSDALIHQKIVVAIVYICSMLMNSIDSTIVNVALATLSRQFNVSAAQIDLVVVSYLVSLGRLHSRLRMVRRSLRHEAHVPDRARHLHVCLGRLRIVRHVQ